MTEKIFKKYAKYLTSRFFTPARALMLAAALGVMTGCASRASAPEPHVAQTRAMPEVQVSQPDPEMLLQRRRQMLSVALDPKSPRVTDAQPSGAWRIPSDALPSYAHPNDLGAARQAGYNAATLRHLKRHQLQP